MAGTRRHRVSSKIIKLKKLLKFSGLICALYLVALATLYMTGDSENESGFLHSDVNFALGLLVGICFVIFIAAVIKSYYLDDKEGKQFKPYRILGFVMSAIFLLLLLMLLLKTDDIPNEFRQEQLNTAEE
jgi:hypothetical protein